MTPIRTMMATTGLVSGPWSIDELIACVEACVFCSQTCVSCADGLLLGHSAEERAPSIGIALSCADVCTTTARALGREVALDQEALCAILSACRDVCARCAEQYEEHPGHTCSVCAGACRTAQDACSTLLAAHESAGAR